MTLNVWINKAFFSWFVGNHNWELFNQKISQNPTVTARLCLAPTKYEDKRIYPRPQSFEKHDVVCILKLRFYFERTNNFTKINVWKGISILIYTVKLHSLTIQMIKYLQK